MALTNHKISKSYHARDIMKIEEWEAAKGQLLYLCQKYKNPMSEHTLAMLVMIQIGA